MGGANVGGVMSGGGRAIVRGSDCPSAISVVPPH